MKAALIILLSTIAVALCADLESDKDFQRNADILNGGKGYWVEILVSDIHDLKLLVGTGMISFVAGNIKYDIMSPADGSKDSEFIAASALLGELRRARKISGCYGGYIANLDKQRLLNRNTLYFYYDEKK